MIFMERFCKSTAEIFFLPFVALKLPEVVTAQQHSLKVPLLPQGHGD